MLNLSKSKKTPNIPLKDWPQLIKKTFRSFFEADSLFHGAALAYYTVFAMVPLLYLSISIAGRIVGQDAVLKVVKYVLQSKVGLNDVDGILVFVKSLNLTKGNWGMELISILFLLVTSTAVFSCLRSSINWFYGIDIQTLSKRKKIVKNIVFRLISILIIGGITIGVIALYFIQSFLISLLDQYVGHQSFWDVFLSSGLQHVISILGNAGVVVIIFKFVHDGMINWKLAFWGALFTGILLYLGQLLINFYLLNFFFGSKGGGIAGSLFILLAWVYYSSQIIFFGAKFISEYAHWMKQPIRLKSS
jgi:membrane protein